MFSNISKFFSIFANFFKFSRKQKKDQPQSSLPSSQSSSKSQDDSQPQTPVDSSLSANLDFIKKKTGNSSDIVIRPFKIGANSDIEVAVVYVKGMVNNQFINDFLIESLMNNPTLQKKTNTQDMINMIPNEVVALGSVKPADNWDEILTSMLVGNTVIFIDGIGDALLASTQGGEKRSVQESGTNVTIRGSRESFTESIETNLAMLRRIILNPNLWTESMSIGKITKTKVSIMYINGLAKKDIVDEVRSRLKNIDIDSILESGYVEQLIEDQTDTPFPTIYHTDRPDTVAGNLLEGRIAIFVNGTPFVLLAPAVFVQFFQSAEDYYVRPDIGSAIRFLRILVFFISLLGPAIYIGATTFHQEMIPTQLLVVIAAQREAVPFPAVVEAFMMEVAFEVLREAGVRMPKAIGSTVSIVGGLVIGQAAVQAGIVSPAMVIVVAITAIASFATPAYNVAISIRLIRFLFMLSAATFGFFGLMLALLMLLVHLCSLRSFGVPYMAPFAPEVPANFGDTILRRPLWTMKERPRFIVPDENVVREGPNQKPNPSQTTGLRNYNVEGDKNET